MNHKYPLNTKIVHRGDLRLFFTNKCDLQCLRHGIITEQIGVAGPAYWVKWENPLNAGERHIFAEGWLIEDTGEITWA